MQLQPLLQAPPVRPVRGSPQGSGRRIVLKLSAGTFDRVAMLAAASGVSFAEAVRQLIARGLVSNARAGAVGQRRDRKTINEPATVERVP
jgi:predicted NAD/FAD-dependent oxidoreductase